ncbi:MAG: trigger factor [Bacillota bacterium]|nr:trigger factor [Bacillota bacterium]
MYKWEKIDTNKVCLEIEVPVTEVNEALEKAYKKVVKKLAVPGFRKGKVPRKIIENHYGPEIFYEDALEMLVDPSYAKAVKECELEPINKPEMELVQIEKDKPLLYKVTVDVKPEVELCEYKGISVDREKKEITPEDVDKYLSSLREQHARLVTVDDGEVAEKDLAVIDFKGEINGEPFEGGTGENYSLEIGSGSFIEGFEEQLKGARKDETRQVKVTFPENYTKAELAGKDAVFTVTVKEIKRPQLPEMDDAFIQELTEEFSTLEDFKADVENKLKESLRHREKISLESDVIEKVAENSKVEVPEVLVERELDNIFGEFEYYLRMQGLSLEQYGQMVEGGLKKLRDERREEASSRAKANLVLDAIIKKEAVEVSEEEIDQKINEIVRGQKPEDVDVVKIKEQFAKQGRIDIIAHEIRYRKVIDLLVEHAEIIEVEKKEIGKTEPVVEEKAEPVKEKTEESDITDSSE